MNPKKESSDSYLRKCIILDNKTGGCEKKVYKTRKCEKIGTCLDMIFRSIQALISFFKKALVSYFNYY